MNSADAACILLAMNIDAIEFLSEQRSAPLSLFFGFFNFLGEVEGFILIVALIYAAHDKDLAVRLSVLVLLTMTLNHLLKIAIQNPRPFVSEGTFPEKWDVSPFKARELVAEFSTPSGHAMSGSVFYGYLAAALRAPWFYVIAICIIFFIGLARPYIGVHYIEDNLLGWAVGALIILAALRFWRHISEQWLKMSRTTQLLTLVTLTIAVWFASLLAKGGSVADLSVPYLSYFGFLTGIAIATPFEQTHIRFDPKSSSIPLKVLRVIGTIVLVMVPVLIIDEIVEPALALNTYFGHFIYFAGYTIAALVGFAGAPWLFLKLGWVETQDA